MHMCMRYSLCSTVKAYAMIDTYVGRGVETDKNVPLTVVAMQSLEYWSRSTPFPTYVTSLWRLSRNKVRFCKKCLPCPIVLIHKRCHNPHTSKVYKRLRRVWHASCCILVQGEEQSVSAGSPYGERARG